ncbi:competence type IV pilus minor pilin ComGF [Ectobacillus sp. sgz5001026]|uniref:competence type IV pilus minor pilin ComGF n=1 Tax=Ectobacillus sp. sgz5001026 TaxID=3242473 RepID=UPI0036D28F41
MFAIVKREHGFTFFEMLLCLSLLLLLAMLAPHILPKHLIATEKKFLDFEWALCLEQMQMEFREATVVKTLPNKLILQKDDGQVITFERSGNQIIRRVDEKGYEIILQHITSVTFELQSISLRVRVNDIDMQTHSGMITRFFPFQV